MTDTVIPAPTLSPSGWVTSPAEKADYLLSHFFLSMKTQTALYDDKVSSLQWIIEQYSHSPTDVTMQLRAALENYLGRYYPSVSVEVKNNDGPDNVTGIITLTIDVVFTEGTAQYSLGRAILSRESKILDIIKINNG